MKVHCEYTEMWPLEKLVPNPKNPNRHSTEQIERLAQILSYQGFRYPIKVSAQSGFITSGHGRLLAAKKLGLTEVPVSIQDYTDPAQEYADTVADNAVALMAELDLSAINIAIADFGPELDVSNLGLKDFTIDVAEKTESDTQPKEPKLKQVACPQCGHMFHT